VHPHSGLYRVVRTGQVSAQVKPAAGYLPAVAAVGGRRERQHDLAQVPTPGWPGAADRGRVACLNEGGHLRYGPGTGVHADLARGDHGALWVTSISVSLAGAC